MAGGQNQTLRVLGNQRLTPGGSVKRQAANKSASRNGRRLNFLKP
jgi:hypothetical protein